MRGGMRSARCRPRTLCRIPEDTSSEAHPSLPVTEERVPPDVRTDTDLSASRTRGKQVRHPSKTRCKMGLRTEGHSTGHRKADAKIRWFVR